MDKVESALRWIHSILHELRIPYVVSGGLAVRLYGGTRPLYDIDLDVPENRMSALLPFVSEYIVSGPSHYIDEHFDLKLLTLDYNGQSIDITAAESVRVYDRSEGRWIQDPTDLAAVELREIYGLTIPVQKRELLIRYKKLVARATDLEDVQQLEPSLIEDQNA